MSRSDARSTDPVALLEAAVCTRDGAPVLRGLHLRVDPGEVVLVTGPNGAGKSTLLRVLAGLLPLAAGRGQVLGHTLPGAAAAVRRSVTLVGHDSPCYDDLSVRANLRFLAAAAGRRGRVGDAAAEAAGLTAVLDRPVGRLSAGQRRRCALAAAMLRPSRLLLLDEPHAALDADGRRLVDAAVRSAADDGGAVVLVSHETGASTATADREVRLSDGRAVPAGAPVDRTF